MISAVRPCDNPFNAQRLDTLAYVEFDHNLSDIADKLKQMNYRGAICGPHGCGKTAMLQALGDELMRHGLTPLPLFINSDHRGTLPKSWQVTIRKARPTDVLLLDGYDLLPWWARGWVLTRSSNAGGVIVTAHKRVFFHTIAQPHSSLALLNHLIDQLMPGDDVQINTERLFDRAQGNLRDAFRLAYDDYAINNGVSAPK